MENKVFLAAFLLTGMAAFAQKKIVIQGNIERLSQSRHIYINNTAVPIQADGSFEYTKEIEAPHIGMIRTDSSGAAVIWMEEGKYLLACKEVKRENIKSVLMRVPQLSGPQDAVIYNDYENATYSGFINELGGVDKNQVGPQNRRIAAVRYLDSLINRYPETKPLPGIIRSAKFYIGEDALEGLIAKLSPAQLATDEIKQLQNGLARNKKIAKDVFFENFSMQKITGESFRLSDIKGKKLILLDFWASDCGPCRITHPSLIELYRKYADKGLEIVSISLDSKRDAWLKAIEDDKISHWMHVSELKNWETSLVKKYAIPFIPFRFLLDGNYKVISHDDDGQIVVTPHTIEAEFKKLKL